jgi:site-specific recombinase XerD
MHDLLEHYLTSLKERGRSASTIRAARTDLAGFERWWEATHHCPFDPQSLLESDLRAWQQSRQVDDGAAPATINRACSNLRGWCVWLHEQRIIREDPGRVLRDLPNETSAPSGLPDEAVDMLFRVAHRQENVLRRRRDEAVLAILVYTGVRCQEACDLQLRDLDLDGGTLTIRRGKGGLPRRVPLHPSAQRLLRLYLAEVRVKGKEVMVGDVAEREPLLISLDRSAQKQGAVAGLSPRGIAKLMAQLGKGAAGHFRAVAERTSDLGRIAELLVLADRLDHLAPHMLRHSLARRLLHRGAHLPEVQRILGHRRLSTTGRYLNPSDDDLRAAIDRADLQEPLSVTKKPR